LAAGITYDQEIKLADRPLAEWLANFPPPVHFYHAPTIRQNLRAFKKVFAKHYPKARVCFAAKACAHPLILKIASEEGCGADVASYNEVRVALSAGLPPSMLDLNGNCKEDFLIKDAIKQGMNIIADSFEEFARIAEIAGVLGFRPKVLLRISGYELEDVTDDSVFTAGLWTKFGAQLTEVPAWLENLDKYPAVELVGFHTHIGSQVSKVEPYLAVLAKMIELGHLLKAAGGECEVINIGGGFPVEYVDRQTWETIVKMIREGYLLSTKGDWSKVFVWHDGLAGFASDGDARIHLDRWTGERFTTAYPKEKMLEALLTGQVSVKGQKMSAVAALKELGEPTLTIEPGRSVMEDAGVTLAKVGIVKKVAHHHNLVNLEMGITSHGESLIEKPVKKWEIVTDYRRRDPKPFETFIGGNLCFSGDMISKYKVFLQRKPVRGDIIMIHNTGAYTSSLFAANSNLFPRPARVLVGESGQAQLIKKQDSYEEIIWAG
jgi:diaminopimelate decarboxylase